MAIDWNQFVSQPKAADTQAPQDTGQTSYRAGHDWDQFVKQDQQAAQAESKGSLVDTITDPIIALGQGVRSGLEDVGGDIGGLITQALGHISPELADKLNKSGTSIRHALDDSDYKDVNENNPIMNALGKGLGNVGGIVAGGELLAPAKVAEGAGMLEKGINVAKNVGGQGLIGAALAGEGNRLEGAALGAAGPAIVGGISKAIKAGATGLANKFGLNETLKAEINNANAAVKADGNLSLTDKAGASIANYAERVKQVENANYNSIKEIPGKIQAAPIQQKTREIMASEPRMPDLQAGILESISNQAGAMRTMEDAINLKKALSDQYNNFKRGAVSDNLFNQFNVLKTDVSNAIASKAESAGLTGDWRLANKFHNDIVKPLQDSDAFEIAKAFGNRQNNPQAYESAIKGLLDRAQKTPESIKTVLNMMDSNGSSIIQQNMVKKIFDDLNVNPGSFDKNKALRLMNTNINKFDGVMSKDSIDTLKGIRTILEKGGATTAKTPLNAASNNTYFEHALGAGVGGTIGGALGNSVGAVLGGSIGVGTFPKLIQMTGQLLASPSGQTFLKYVGRGGGSLAKIVNRAIKGGVQGLTGAALNSSSEGQ